VHPPSGSPAANNQSRNLPEPEVEEKEPKPQPHNPYRPVTVTLAQPTPAKTEQQNGTGTTPSNAQVPALTGNAWPVIQRIIDILFDLVLPLLFLQISDSTKEDQLVQKANVKLDAALKKKATLDMGKRNAKRMKL
jgi:hypothetical protein